MRADNRDDSANLGSRHDLCHPPGGCSAARMLGFINGEITRRFLAFAARAGHPG